MTSLQIGMRDDFVPTIIGDQEAEVNKRSPVRRLDSD